jgi:hypothetical protein
VIAKTVRESHCVLVCLSRQSSNRAGYLHKEIRMALEAADLLPEGTIFLIPAKLEECEVPERLRPYQWVNFYSNQTVTLSSGEHLRHAPMD